MKHSKLISTLAAASVLATVASAGHYTPKKGDANVGFSLSYTSFDQFWAGSDKQPGVPGGGNIERTSYRSYFFYGIEDNLALDLSVGYADTSSNLSNGHDFTDSSIGLSYQLSDENSGSYDWMVRGGFNIAGSYDTGFLSAPGDGENGFDLMTKFGKTLSSNGTRGDLEIGYTINGGDVPDSARLRVGPTFPVSDTISIDAAGIFFTGIDGIDIGGPGFTGLADLPKVEERGAAGEVGISFNTSQGYYRLSVSQVFDGRNIGEELTIGAFGSFSF